MNGAQAMSPWWLLVFVAVLFTNGTVAWCVAQSRVTSRQRARRVSTRVPPIVDEPAAPHVDQRLNPVHLVPPPHEVPK